MQRDVQNELDRIIAEKIRTFQGQMFATGTNATLFVKRYELGGFDFVQFVIIAPFSVKSHKPCALQVEWDKAPVHFKSDTDEFDTEYSISMDRGITKIDFDATPELKEVLDSKALQSLTLSFDGGAKIGFTAFI